MATPVKIKLDGLDMVVDAVPLELEAFKAFGDVVANPRPDLHPAMAAKANNTAGAGMPFDAIVANQGTAIKYQHVSRMENLYSQAPSGRTGAAVSNMFVCASRALPRQLEAGVEQEVFPVTVLERHPFTSQTFVPLRADSQSRYLVVVAPSLSPSAKDQQLPVPSLRPPEMVANRELPGRGLPDLKGVRAFIATTDQAVTYGAGTWHSPMVALAPADKAIDFFVFQFANEVALEDCQEVFFGPSTVTVRLPPRSVTSKL